MSALHFIIAVGAAPVCSGSTPMRMKRTTEAHRVTCIKCRKFIEKREAAAAAAAAATN